MYHAIVKRIALQNFLRVNQKDYTPILKGCSPDIHHRFGGDHALGGERHDRDALKRGVERLGRLAPTVPLTAPCRIFADMGQIWRERSSCRSNSELAVIPA